MKGGKRPWPRFRSEEYFVYEISEEIFYPNFETYRDLYGDAMLVLTWMSSNIGGRKPTETSVIEFCYKSENLFFEKLINIKVILFLKHDVFR